VRQEGEFFSARDHWPHKDSLLTVFRYQLAARAAQGKKVLELGCGAGEGAHILAPPAASYTGVDHKPHWREASLKPPETADFVESDVCDLPRAWNRRFDVVVAFELLEHLEDPAEFTARIKRVLRKNGILILSTPNFDLFSRGPGPSRRPLFEHHRHEYGARAFESFLKRGELDCFVVGLSQLSVPAPKRLQVLAALGACLLELKPGAEWPKLEVAWAESLAKTMPLEFAQCFLAVSRGAEDLLSLETRRGARMSAERAAALSARWVLWRKNEHLREVLAVVENRNTHLAELEEILAARECTIEAREEEIKKLSEIVEAREEHIARLEELLERSASQPPEREGNGCA